jgi:diaminopimelate decarboxylase
MIASSDTTGWGVYTGDIAFRPKICMMVRCVSLGSRAHIRARAWSDRLVVANRNKQKTVGGADPATYTPFCGYRAIDKGAGGEERLYCEDVPVEKIADTVGTPAFVYSRASIEAGYKSLDRALGALPHTICYAMKANSNLAVLRVFARLGSAFDVVSGGELDRLRRIAVAGKRIVFSGVGKTREEIREALRYPGTGRERGAGGGILLFNIESEAELEVLLEEAARHVKRGGARPAVAIRINPDVAAGGHRHISTGKHHHKFGVGWETARRLYLAHRSSPWIAWRGISAHLGSQIFSTAPYRQGLERLASHVRELAANGVRLETLDIGGGLGIRYTNEQPLDLAAYARTLVKIVRPLGCKLLIEPGRWLVGPAGLLLTRVIYVKRNRGKTFVVVDAAMNDLIRPVLYQAEHPITPAARRANHTAVKKKVDVVGPVCESGDFLAQDYPLEQVRTGDVLAVWVTGAYGFVESSNYNARRRAAEVLVEARRFRVARRRETYDDMVRQELDAVK